MWQLRVSTTRSWSSEGQLRWHPMQYAAFLILCKWNCHNAGQGLVSNPTQNETKQSLRFGAY